MPELLHEQTGLKIVRNDKNRFCVVTLHYTADPSKRDPAWIAEAKAGMPPARWAKEYEIDYEALYGARVFPEISVPNARIIIPEPYPEFPDNQFFWGGLDYGSRNPSSFHIYTIWEDCIYCIWELYEPCKNIPDFARKMLDCPYYDRIRYIAADPNIIYTKNTRNKFGDIVTMNDLLIEQGIRKCIPGNKDETSWVAMMRQHWADPEDPTFLIFSRCPNIIREFSVAVYSGETSRQQLSNTYRESIEDVNNHAMDDCKYFMNSRPKTLQRRNWKDPIMVKAYSNVSGSGGAVRPVPTGPSRQPLRGYY
jgi:hypothetical protein